MYNFCTYFDQNYLVQGLTLYSSLTRHADPFVLWVLCLDDLTYDLLSRLDLQNLRAIPLAELEGDDKPLLAAKQDRTQVEYYFTCTPSWPLYILNHFPEVDVITYLDADIFFFSSPAPILEELGRGSILIVEHRFPEHLRHLERYGIYNVGLAAFRDDSYGRECLDWWRQQCLDWCYDRLENGRFADQKYLDDWPARFRQVATLQHKGAGLAPWNLDNYSLVLRDGRVLVDSHPLVFYHFHNLKQVGRRLFDPGLERYGSQASSVLKRHVYEPYVRGLFASAKWLSGLADQSPVQLASMRYQRPGVQRPVVKHSLFRRVLKNLQHRLFLSKRVYHDDLWLVIGGRIL